MSPAWIPSVLLPASRDDISPKARSGSTIRGWRPIALLSCLAKGLEGIIVKRMSYHAITSDVVGPQQFGALPKRSATDLVSCVVHDTEEARSQGWASTFVTPDVESAFDAVLHNRLVLRMQAQGWPASILRWTSSFLSNRGVQCGVPQGSPISPLLFLLYMAEPLRSGNPRARSGYANAIGILGIGPTSVESALAAEREVDSLLVWAKEDAVSFDTEKSEVIHINCRRQDGPISILINDSRIEPAEHIRWLGVHLDSKLSFNFTDDSSVG
ncbi:hypothetical protein K3495_g13690 [Podosphaera aphanis]|nr:hypothetical protein K3495_g13690 [Podosphaera aphanis]